MTFWPIVFSAVAGVGLGLLMMYFKNSDYSNVFVITQKDFISNMRKGQLIDVRKKISDPNDKIKGSRNYPPRKVTSKGVNLRKDLSVYLYCDDGKLSKKVAKRLSKKGYSYIYVLSEGYSKYKKNN